MASYATYSQPSTSTIHDNGFHLYSYQPVTNEGYTTIYAPQPQSMNASFGAFDAYQSYPRNTHQDFVLDTDTSHHQATPNARYYPQSPAHSPTSSAANSFDLQPPILSSTSDSGASVQSTVSSAIGSPSMNAKYSTEWTHMSGNIPNIVHRDTFTLDAYPSSGFEYESMMAPKYPGFVDPSLIQPTSPSTFTSTQFSGMPLQSPNLLFPPHEPPSPALSANSIHSSSRLSSGPIRTNRATSPYQWNPYNNTMQHPPRRPSISSVHSQQSSQSRISNSSQDSSEEGKGICPIPSCGRHIKDLKAHLLTHKNERPEKCPIASCDYHIKGFARKYDKNRHTLTHYKGTMVCGFCPGSGSSSEKSFNRADVFKRHLTSVHGVEQTAPNSRRKSLGSGKGSFGMMETKSGVCSTCGILFANAQDFYEHLDDCVLRVVQQGDPAEAINERILTSIAQDKSVQQTMERHMLSNSLDFSAPTTFDQEDEEEDSDKEDSNDITPGSRKQRRDTVQDQKPDETAVPHLQGNGNFRQGLTRSKGGVPLNNVGKGNKRRKNYPLSWGAAPEKMHMKKRVMCVFDGPRRLWKDDMMLDSRNEVRVTLPGGDGRLWVTDLDIQTLRRAEGLHAATEEEKGPWLDENGRPIEYSLM